MKSGHQCCNPPLGSGIAMPPPEGITPPLPPATCSGFYYTVQPNDSLFTIGQRYGCTVNQMIAANPQIINPDVIYVGQVICVPRCQLADPQPPSDEQRIEIIIRIPKCCS